MKKVIFLISILFLSIGAKEIDSTTGLIVDRGLEDVKENCTVCHTGRFIVVNGGNKKFWRKKIIIMQKAYGLWKINKRQKDRIINYLAKNYSKKREVSIDK